MPIGDRDSTEMRAVGVSIPPIDDAQKNLIELVRAALNEERQTGVPVSEAFVERVCAAFSQPARKVLRTLALHEFMDGRASVGEVPAPLAPRK